MLLFQQQLAGRIEENEDETQAGIQTECLPNTNQKRYRLSHVARCLGKRFNEMDQNA
jgi:hypothetical protein